MTKPTEENLSALLQEKRLFQPREEFCKQANAGDPGIYERAKKDPEAFWAAEAQHLDWFEPWKTVLEWKTPWVKWLPAGKSM